MFGVLVVLNLTVYGLTHGLCPDDKHTNTD